MHQAILLSSESPKLFWEWSTVWPNWHGYKWPWYCKWVRPRYVYFSVWKTVFLFKKHKTTNPIFFSASFYSSILVESEESESCVCVHACVRANWSETRGLATTIMPDLPNRSAGSITSNIQTHTLSNRQVHSMSLPSVMITRADKTLNAMWLRVWEERARERGRGEGATNLNLVIPNPNHRFYNICCLWPERWRQPQSHDVNRKQRRGCPKSHPLDSKAGIKTTVTTFEKTGGTFGVMSAPLRDIRQ